MKIIHIVQIVGLFTTYVITEKAVIDCQPIIKTEIPIRTHNMANNPEDNLEKTEIEPIKIEGHNVSSRKVYLDHGETFTDIPKNKRSNVSKKTRKKLMNSKDLPIGLKSTLKANPSRSHDLQLKLLKNHIDNTKSEDVNLSNVECENQDNVSTQSQKKETKSESALISKEMTNLNSTKGAASNFEYDKLKQNSAVNIQSSDLRTTKHAEEDLKIKPHVILRKLSKNQKYYEDIPEVLAIISKSQPREKNKLHGLNNKDKLKTETIYDTESKKSNIQEVDITQQKDKQPVIKKNVNDTDIIRIKQWTLPELQTVKSISDGNENFDNTSIPSEEKILESGEQSDDSIFEETVLNQKGDEEIGLPNCDSKENVETESTQDYARSDETEIGLEDSIVIRDINCEEVLDKNSINENSEDIVTNDESMNLSQDVIITPQDGYNCDDITHPVTQEDSSINNIECESPNEYIMKDYQNDGDEKVSNNYKTFYEEKSPRISPDNSYDKIRRKWKCVELEIKHPKQSLRNLNDLKKYIFNKGNAITVENPITPTYARRTNNGNGDVKNGYIKQPYLFPTKRYGY